MRRIFKLFILLAIMAVSLPSFGQGLKAFKLKNGLSVYIWEDNTKSDVYGIVAVGQARSTTRRNTPDWLTTWNM